MVLSRVECRYLISSDIRCYNCLPRNKKLQLCRSYFTHPHHSKFLTSKSEMYGFTVLTFSNIWQCVYDREYYFVFCIKVLYVVSICLKISNFDYNLMIIVHIYNRTTRMMLVVSHNYHQHSSALTNLNQRSFQRPDV